MVRSLINVGFAPKPFRYKQVRFPVGVAPQGEGVEWPGRCGAVSLRASSLLQFGGSRTSDGAARGLWKGSPLPPAPILIRGSATRARWFCWEILFQNPTLGPKNVGYIRSQILHLGKFISCIDSFTQEQGWKCRSKRNFLLVWSSQPRSQGL